LVCSLQSFKVAAKIDINVKSKNYKRESAKKTKNRAKMNVNLFHDCLLFLIL